MATCDRCGKSYGSASMHGSAVRQASLFDIDAPPLATETAREELRTGRRLCDACARTLELFPTDPLAAPPAAPAASTLPICRLCGDPIDPSDIGESRDVDGGYTCPTCYRHEGSDAMSPEEAAEWSEDHPAAAPPPPPPPAPVPPASLADLLHLCETFEASYRAALAVCQRADDDCHARLMAWSYARERLQNARKAQSATTTTRAPATGPSPR